MIEKTYRIYTTYEEPFANQKFTTEQMKEIYVYMVDKNEYPDFQDWLMDMLKSGVFEETEESQDV